MRIMKLFLFLVMLMVVIAVGTLGAFYVAMQMRESGTPEALKPPAGHIIDTRDAKVMVLDQGLETHPPVVLIHGTGSWSGFWWETTEPLAYKDYRVIAIDLPPFGYSEKLKGADSYTTAKQAHRIIDVLDKLGVTQAAVVCHSVGCRPAIEAVMEKPAIASKLVLVDPAVGFADDEKNPHFEQNHPEPWLKHLLALHPLRNALISVYGTSPFSISQIFSGFVYNPASVSKARVDMLKLPLKVKGTTAAWGDWFENLVTGHESAYVGNFGNFKALKMPVLLVWGKEDTTTPYWQAGALQKLIPQAQLVTIDACGHIPYMEKTGAFNEALLEFLTGP